MTLYLGEQGWRSGESTRLPPIWPRFDSLTRRHMWVEFVVGFRSCFEGFSPVFLPPLKPTSLNSNSTWNARTPLNEFLELFGVPWVNKLHFLHIFSIWSLLNHFNLLSPLWNTVWCKLIVANAAPVLCPCRLPTSVRLWRQLRRHLRKLSSNSR